MDFRDFGLTIGAGRRLILAGVRLGWLWAIVGLLALGLVIVLYRYERALVSKRAGRTLLVLRLLAASALVAALFEPIARVTYREAIRGRLIVGVDLSESMATADRGRPAAEGRALSRALDLSPTQEPADLSRREVARRLLDGPWWKGLAEGRDVRALGFDRDAVPGSAEALAGRLKGAKPDDPAALTTDWGPVLESALREEGGAPVLGVVLLTDGRRNAEGDAGSVIDRLAARGIPVYPVMIGSASAPRDAAIAAIKAPDGVYKGDVAGVEVTVKLDGPAAGAEVPVTLDRPGASPIRQMVKAPGDGSRPVVTFRVPLDSVGPQALTVAVGPIEGDVRPENDRKSVVVQVADDKARVLLIDGEPRWEFRYLKNALSRDPRVVVDSIVLRQPPAPPSAEATYKGAIPPRPEAPNSADPIGGFDAILVGDLPPDAVPADFWKRIDAYVAERGGTLILSAGPRSLAGLSGGDLTRKLLPVIAPREVPFDPNAADPARPALPAGVAIRPLASATADAWPMLQFAAEPSRSREVWENLPRLPWAVAGRAKPSATVLASAVGTSKDEDAAVIAAMPYGLGKVLWIGTDSTWRWRYLVGDAYHHRFWGQAVRWAASGKLAAGNRLVRFGPDRPKIGDGEAARLRARFADDAPGVNPSLLVAARVFRASKDAKNPASTTSEGEAVAVVPLRPKPGEPRAFEGPAPGLPPGRYVVRLDVPQLADALKAEGPPPEAALEVAARETSELVELSASRDPLDRLAAATSGRVFADYEAADLLPILKSKDRETVRTEETPLWDRPWALVLFLGVLTVEWVVRKRAGLP